MPMKDSRMTDEWLAQQVAYNPITVLPDGTIRTCPVRLLFENAWVAAKRKDDEGNAKEGFDVTIGFPMQATEQVIGVLYPLWYMACQEKHPKLFDAQRQPQGLIWTPMPNGVQVPVSTGGGLHWPFHDGKTKPQYGGYTPGTLFVSCGSEYKPAIVDTALNPIVDRGRIYSGAWAIVGLNCYGYSNKKKGAGFGLQTIMLIADDEKLGAGGADPKKVYEGIKIDASFNPAAAFNPAGGQPGAPPPPPQSIMPPAAPVYAPPAPAYAPSAAAYQQLPPAALDYDPIG
jgi:hypothetical protein